MFRYGIVQENYNLIKIEVEDDNKIYCKEEIVDVRKDLVIALSFVQEFILKSDFEDNNPNSYSYMILMEGQEYFDEYLNDIELYCKGTVDNIKDVNYDMYRTYITRYNNISVSRDLRSVVLFKEIRE